MRHDDVLGEDVLQEEVDNVRQVVMETARLLSWKLWNFALTWRAPVLRSKHAPGDSVFCPTGTCLGLAGASQMPVVLVPACPLQHVTCCLASSASQPLGAFVGRAGAGVTA